MARYVYNKDAVSEVIDQLETAIDELSDVNTEILEGFSTIQTARGGQYINIDSADALKYKDIADQAIRDVIKDIRAKAQAIEEYNSASWLKKASSTVAMAFTKFSEGFFSAGENILDGFASLGGMVVGIFSKDAQNSIGEFIAKDHVGDAYKAAYNGGILSDVEKYSAFSSESTAANVFKGFGTATGYALAAVATGGSAASLGANMGVAFVGGLGSGTQEGLQAGLDYDDAFVHGTAKGAVSAGTVYVFSKGSELIGKGIQRIVGNTNAGGTVPSEGMIPGTDNLALPPGGETTLATTSTTANSAGSSAGMLDDIVNVGGDSLSFDRVDILNASGDVVASTYEDIATTVAGNTSLMNNVAPTATASATPLGLPAGAESLATVTTEAGTLATVTAAPTSLATAAPAVTAVPTATAAASSSGIPPVLSVAPQYMNGESNTTVTPVNLLDNATGPTVTPSQPDVTPTPEPTVTPPQPDVTPTPGPTVTPPQPDVTPTPGPTVTPPQPDVTPTPGPAVTPSQPDVTPTPGPAVTPSQPDVTPRPWATVTPISQPTISDDVPTVPEDESILTITPDDPIYKHKQATRDIPTSSNGLAKGVASTIVGLGVAGAAGAVGYGIYNKKKREEEDEEDER